MCSSRKTFFIMVNKYLKGKLRHRKNLQFIHIYTHWDINWEFKHKLLTQVSVPDTYLLTLLESHQTQHVIEIKTPKHISLFSLYFRLMDISKSAMCPETMPSISHTHLFTFSPILLFWAYTIHFYPLSAS